MVVIAGLAIGSITACGDAPKSGAGAAPTPDASAARTPTADDSDRVTVRIALGNNGRDVSNGGVSGRGHFTASGAITDHGSATTYRTVKGSLPGGVITLRIVTVGKKGHITYRVTIDTDAGTSRWSVSSGTKAYSDLHGHGAEIEDPNHTTSTLVGTVAT